MQGADRVQQAAGARGVLPLAQSAAELQHQYALPHPPDGCSGSEPGRDNSLAGKSESRPCSLAVLYHDHCTLMVLGGEAPWAGMAAGQT